MFVQTMKPATLQRRAVARTRDRAEAKAERMRRLHELAMRDGPDSIWAELLVIEYAVGRPQ